MLINVVNALGEEQASYHVNPNCIVGVSSDRYVDFSNGMQLRIDCDSYERVIAWLEQAR